MSASSELAAALRRMASVSVAPPEEGTPLARAGVAYLAKVTQRYPELDEVEGYPVTLHAAGVGSNPYTALHDAAVRLVDERRALGKRIDARKKLEKADEG